MWTLVYNAVEQTLADWLVVDDYARESENKGNGSVTLRTAEAFDAGPTQWLAGEKAVIYRDRLQASNGTFSGGTIWAQGYFDDPTRQNYGGAQHVIYRLHNIWWLLQQHTYQQPRYVVTAYNSEATPPETFTNLFTPEVFLGEAVVPGELTGYSTQMQTNGEEITEILNWVNECFNPTKRGATEGRSNAQDVLTVGTIEPKLYIGIKRVASIFCAEAIIDVLRLQRDSIVWVDETTVPPTVNVRTLGKWNYTTSPPTFIDYTNLPEVVINITAEQETRILVQGQTWKQVPAVIIFWWGTNEIGSQSVPFCYIDDYPGGITTAAGGMHVPNDGYVPMASVHFMVLQGAKVTTETAYVNTEPLSELLTGNQAAQVAWWKRHDATLADPKVDAGTIVVGTPTVLDASGTAINTAAYPNILVDTHLPKWASGLGLGWQHAIIRAEVAFTRYADGAKHIVETKPRIRLIHKRVKVTNASTGSITATTSVTPGESIPQGIAESVFRSTNAPQWAGTIEFTGAQARSDISFGNRYRLVGPNTTFYNVLPQRIVERPCSGAVEMVYGPAPTASIDALLEIVRATRYRTTWRLPSGRDNGSDIGGGQVDTGADTPTDDTSHSPGGNSYDSTTHQVS